MIRTMVGRVRGKTIELLEDLGVPEGQEVEVVVRVSASKESWGEGIRRSAGIAADTPGVAEAFAEIERERKATGFRGARE